MRKKSKVLRLFCLTLVWIVLLSVSACERRPAVDVKKEIGLSLRRPEIMLVVATERNRYEQTYTEQIWDVVVAEDGTTFQEYLLNQIKQFASDIKRICAMAEEYDIALDNREQEQLRLLSQDYYSQLTEEDKAYTEAEFEDVLSLYQEYYLACKTVNELTKGADLEISDNEAKVVEVEQIVVDDESLARELGQMVRAEDADFAAIAKENSLEEEIQKKVVRGELGAAAEEAVFSMDEGEVSQVIEEDGRFYLFHCLNPYDQEATLERKQEMMLLRKDRVFREYFDAFLEENLVTVSGRAWQDISCVTQVDTTTTNLFELYKEYFPN